MDYVTHKDAAVGQVDEYYGLPFIDLYNEAYFINETFDLYLKDSVHITRAAYEQEAKGITPYLIEILQG